MEQPLKVLLIEDSAFYVSLIRELLHEQNGGQFQVDSVGTLNEGLAQLAAAHHDVVLLDLTLPDCGGLETLVRTRAVARRTPIIVVTSLDDEAISLQSLDLGAADYLVKGEMNANWLLRSIRYAWHRAQKESSADRTGRQMGSLLDRIVETTKSECEPGRWDVAIKVRRLVSIQELETFRDRLSNLLKRKDCHKIRLDFGEVEYVSNATMSTLLFLNKNAKAADSVLVLSNVSKPVRDQFASRRFDSVFQFENVVN